MFYTHINEAVKKGDAMKENLEFLIKSLHVCLKMPVVVFDSNFKVIREYRSNQTISFFHNYNLLKRIINERDYFYYINGNFNEMYLLYLYKENYFLFGPFKCNIIDKEFFQKKMLRQKISIKNQEILYDYLVKLPLYSLSDIRDILILVHYIFTGEIENLPYDKLHNSLKDFSENTLLSCKGRELLSDNFSEEGYLFWYENKILEYVKSGDVVNLKKVLSEFSGGVIPPISGDIMRTEKNYSIIIFEKLVTASISLGLDVVVAYQSRGRFIRENEQALSLEEILLIRESAIVFYTKKVSKINSIGRSPLIKKVVQYIGINLHKKLTAKEISEYFLVSETKLRLNFKKEMGITLHSYIEEQKISIVKEMLKSEYTINEIALSLGFSDSSHLSKSFKKHMGVSPKQYQHLFKNIKKSQDN